MTRRSLHHRARVGAIAAVLVGMLLGGEGEADAKCVDVGCIVGWVWVLAVPVVIAGATVFVIDVQATAIDIGEASTHKVSSTGRARFDTAWGGTQTAIGGTLGIALAVTDDFTTAFGVLALTSWPLALGMHGAWAQRTDPYQGFPSAALPVVALDAGILAYDVVRFAQRAQPSSGYGFAEILGAMPQLGFGIAAAAGGRGADAPATLAMTAAPALVFAHGIWEMVAKRHVDPPVDDTVRTPPAVTWRVLPTLGRDSTKGSLGVSLVGRF